MPHGKKVGARLGKQAERLPTLTCYYDIWLRPNLVGLFAFGSDTTMQYNGLSSGELG